MPIRSSTTSHASQAPAGRKVSPTAPATTSRTPASSATGGEPSAPSARRSETGARWRSQIAAQAAPIALIDSTGVAIAIATSRRIQGVTAPIGRSPPPRMSTPTNTACAAANIAAAEAPKAAPSSVSLKRRSRSRISGPPSVSSTPSAGRSRPPVTV
jgi:hypothetical protein